MACLPHLDDKQIAQMLKPNKRTKEKTKKNIFSVSES